MGNKSYYLFFLFLTCCSSAPTFPVTDVYVAHTRFNNCTHYKRTGTELVKFEVLPLASCEGNLGVTPEDYRAIMDWVEDMDNSYTCELKK